MTTIDTTAPTGDAIDDTPTPRPPLAARRRRTDDVTDAEILEAVRGGDQQSFDVLYRRHRPAVQRLARRLARNAADADDIVSEVFAATLRATMAGRGPTDDAGPYLLRSVRNTATSIGTRGDGHRARATPDDDLARLAPTTETIEPDAELGEAFRDLPDRFRSVLWSTEIEGATPADLAADGTDARGVASLSHRARCALRRSYLSVSTRRRCTDPACRSARSTMPAVVLGDAAASTVARIDRHVISCGECAAVFDQMQLLAERMPSRSLLAVLLAFIRNVGGVTASVVGGAAPIIVVPAAVATLTAGAIVATDIAGDRASTAVDPVEQVVAPPPIDTERELDVPPTLTDSSDTETGFGPPADELSPTSPARAPIDETAPGAKTNAPTRTPTDPAPGVGGTGGVELLPGDADNPPAVAPAVERVDDVPAESGVLGTTVGELDDAVDELGGAVDETVVVVATGVDDALEPVTAAIDDTVDELESSVRTAVEPVTGALEPVVEPVIGLVDEVGSTVLGTDAVVPTTVPAVPSTGELVDGTTDVVVDVGDSATDLVGGPFGG